MKGITMKQITIEIEDGGRVLFDGIVTNYRWAWGVKAVKLKTSHRKAVGDFDTTVWFDEGIESIVVGHYHSKTVEFTKELEISMIRDIYIHYIRDKAQKEILNSIKSS